MENKKKKFNLFDWYYKNGRGVDKGEPEILENPGIKNYFRLMWRKLSKLLSVNILLVFGNFPIFFLLLTLTDYFSKSSTSPLQPVFATVLGASMIDESGSLIPLMANYGNFVPVRINSTANYVLLGLTLLLLFTMGPVKVGTTYLLRNFVKGEPVFVLSDFFYIIKRNLKQSLLYGFFDTAVVGLLAYDFYYLIGQFGDMLNEIMFFLTVFMLIVYLTMRTYVYLMMITFDLPIRKLLKNGLIFAMLGLKRNAVAWIGVILLAVLNFGIFLLIQPLGLVLPFVLTWALVNFTLVYGAYPKIHELMVVPQLNAEAVDEEE